MAKSYVCFDIGSENLKMVELSGDSSTTQLRAFGSAPLDFRADMTNEDKNMMVAQTMRGLLDEQKIKGRNISISISGQSVFTRFVRLPAVDSSKVAQIIKYEAQQQVPFPIDEVEWDYEIIGGNEEEIDVVLVAIKKDILMDQIEALKKVGLSIEVISVAPLSIYNCTEFNEDLFSEATAVIDLGAKTTSLIVCDGDGLWSRNIPIGSQNITQAIAKELEIEQEEAEKLKFESFVSIEGKGVPSGSTEEQLRISSVVGSVCKRLVIEIKRSIGFYHTQSKGSSISKALLSGGGLVLQNFHPYLEEALKVPIERLFPIKKLSIAPSIDRDRMNAVMHTLCDSIGLGLRMLGKTRLSVNLVPKIIAYQKELSKKKVFIVGATLLLIATMATFAMKAQKIRQVNEQETQIIESKIRQLEPYKRKIQNIKKEIGSFHGKLESIKKLQNARLYWVDFIDMLKSKKPRDAWFTKIQVGGIKRTSSFGSDMYSPYGGMGSMGPSMMGPSGYGPTVGGPGMGMADPYSAESLIEGEKGSMELMGYLKVRKISADPDANLARQIEELKMTLQHVKPKEQLGRNWNDFKTISMPNPPANQDLKHVYSALKNRKSSFEKQIEAYIEKNSLPKSNITENVLDRILDDFTDIEKAPDTASEEDGDKSADTGKVDAVENKKPDVKVDVKTEDDGNESEDKTLIAEINAEKRIPSGGKELSERDMKDYEGLKNYNDKFEAILAEFNITVKSDFFGNIDAKEYKVLDFYRELHKQDVAKFVFKASLRRPIDF